MFRTFVLEYARELGFKVSDDMICAPDGTNCQQIEEWLRSPLAVYIALEKRALEVAYDLLKNRRDRNKDMISIEVVQQFPNSCWAAATSALTFYARNIDPGIQEPSSDVDFINQRYNSVPLPGNQAVQATMNAFNLSSTITQKANGYINTTDTLGRTERIKELYRLLDDTAINNLCRRAWGSNFETHYRKIFFYKQFYDDSGLDTAFRRLWFDDECGLKYEHINPDNDIKTELEIVSVLGNSGPFITAVLPEILLYNGKDLERKMNSAYGNTTQGPRYHYIIIYNIDKDNNNTVISIWSSLCLYKKRLLSKNDVEGDPKLRSLIPTCQIKDVSLEDLLLCWKTLNKLLGISHSKQTNNSYLQEYNNNDYIPIVTLR